MTRLSDERLRYLRHAGGDFEILIDELIERRAADKDKCPPPVARYASGEEPMVGDVVQHPADDRPWSHYVVLEVDGNMVHHIGEPLLMGKRYGTAVSALRLIQRGPRKPVTKDEVQKTAHVIAASAYQTGKSWEQLVSKALRDVLGLEVEG